MVDEENNFVKFLRETINEEKKIALQIYFDLYTCYLSHTEVYGEQDNIFKIFFMQILKLLTNIAYKKYELNHKINIPELYHKQISSWPYLSYHEIHQNKIGQKNYKFNQNDNKLGKKISLLKFLQKFHYSNEKTNIYITYDAFNEFNAQLKLLIFKKAKFINSKNLYQISNKERQIKSIIDSLSFVIDNSKYLIDHRDLRSLIQNHILSHFNTSNNEIDTKYNDSLLITGSHMEIQNRLIANYAKRFSAKIINITHGESFGVLDEPSWGFLGDSAYSDIIIGYGEGYSSVEYDSKYIKLNSRQYLSRNANLNKIFSQEKIIKKGNIFQRICYFPTSLRGHLHRFGPYQDTADSVYIKWQETLIDFFNRRITVKKHPKEKYEYLYPERKCNVDNRKFYQIKDYYDVFIFDYYSTIFVEACATDKPVIFFDLGIRNFSDLGLKKIKERVIYFDILNEGMPTINEVTNRLENENKSSSLINTFSVTANNNDIYQLIKGVLKKVL